MVKAFLDGEVYTNAKSEQDIFVFAVTETKEGTQLAVGFVDRETAEIVSSGKLLIKKSEYSDWERVDF